MKKKTILSILGSVLLAGVIGVAGVVGFSNRMTDEEKTELVHNTIAQLPDGTSDGIYIGYSEDTEEVIIKIDTDISSPFLTASNEIAYNNYSSYRDTVIQLNDNIRDILKDNGVNFVDVVSLLINEDDMLILEVEDGKVESDAVEELR